MIDTKLAKKIAIEALLQAWDTSQKYYQEIIDEEGLGTLEKEDYELIQDELFTLRDLFLEMIPEE